MIDSELDTPSMIANMLQIAGPAILQLLLALLQEIVNLFFAGHLGDPVLMAAVGIGNMFINAFFLAIVMGLNFTISTFTAQFYGAGNVQICGLYLNRGRVVLSIVVPVLAVLMLVARPILRGVLMQDAEVAAYAQRYISSMLPGLIAYAYYDAAKSFLNGFGLTKVPM